MFIVTFPTCKILSTPKSSDMMTPLSKRPLSLRGFSLSKTPFNYLSTATCKTVSDCVRRMAQKRELGLRGLAVVHWTSACSLEIRSREIEKERKKEEEEGTVFCFACSACRSKRCKVRLFLLSHMQSILRSRRKACCCCC